MSKLPALPFVLSILSAGLGAQTLTSISPKIALDPRYSNGVSGLGFGYGWDSNRLQQIFNHDSFTTPVTQPLIINSIRYRKPKIGSSTGSGRIIEVALDLSVGAAGVTAATASSSFEKNLDPLTTKRVFSKKKLILPNLTTFNFDFKIPLDSGRTFLYAPSKKLALVLDIWTYTFKASPYTYYVDGWTRARSGAPSGADTAIVWGRMSSSSDFGTSSSLGTGCTTSAKKPALHSADAKTLTVGDKAAAFFGSTGVPNLPGLMTLGARSINVILPGTRCGLWNDILFLLPILGDARGDTSLTLPIPADTRFALAVFYSQMIWLDPKANSPGIVTSNSLKNTIGRGFPPSGSLYSGRGLITQFTN